MRAANKGRNSILTGAQPYGASFAKVIVTKSARRFFIPHYYFSRARAIKNFAPPVSSCMYFPVRPGLYIGLIRLLFVLFIHGTPAEKHRGDTKENLPEKPQKEEEFGRACMSFRYFYFVAGFISVCLLGFCIQKSKQMTLGYIGFVCFEISFDGPTQKLHQSIMLFLVIA